MSIKKKIFRLYSLIFARPVLYSFNRFIYDLGLKGMGIYNPYSGEKYFYSKILPKIIQKKAPVIFDVGANVGKHTLNLQKIFPEARIYCFEPNPKCFEKLRKVENDSIRIFNVALGSETTKLKLYDRKVHEVTKHSSFYKEVITDLHKSDLKVYEIDVTKLDEICSQEKVKSIDFIKIDTEGSEYQVLLGAADLIKKGSIKCIQFEFNTMNVVSRTFFRDFIKILKYYDLYRILPRGVLRLDSNIKYTEIFGLQNIVAILDENK